MFLGQKDTPNPAKTFFLFRVHMFLGLKDTPNPAKTFFLEIAYFWERKHSNFSEELYIAFPTLALAFLPPLS